jgi:hypothetical protein
LTKWKLALARGVLPSPGDVEWPQEPFRSKFVDALSSLEMARFTRRYPAVLETLINQMLSLVKDFEQKLLEAEAKRDAQQRQKQRPPPPPQQQQQQPGQQQQRQDEEGGDEDEARAEGQGAEGDGQQEEQELTQEQLEQALEQAAANAQQGGKQGKEIKITIESAEGAQDKKVARCVFLFASFVLCGQRVCIGAWWFVIGFTQSLPPFLHAPLPPATPSSNRPPPRPPRRSSSSGSRTWSR